MKSSDQLLDIDVVILAGGLGTRLRVVIKDKPKCLAPINGKPFIDILLEHYIEQGLKRFIICVGHLHEQVTEHLKERDDCEIIFSLEDEPLGTGGAVKKAIPLVESENVLVANGDSICSVDYLSFLNFHRYKKADFSMVLSKDDARQDAGNVKIDKNAQIVSFNEKDAKGNGFINSGIYIMQTECFKQMPTENKFSLEYDLFPVLIKSAKCFGYAVDSKVYDIGTPERLEIYLSLVLV